LIGLLASLVRARAAGRRLRVAVDGPDAAGKTTLADEISPILRDSGFPVLRASIDGFHHPAGTRHQREDEHPALSYYEDSFDYATLRRVLLDPFAEGSRGLVRTRVFDHRRDEPIDEPPQSVREGAVLLFDGVFLLRPELAASWDLSIFLRVDPEVSLNRALERDIALFGTADAVAARYRRRYLPGQALYVARADPEGRADVLIDNTDFAMPLALRLPDS
jgi:uridine kinase